MSNLSVNSVLTNKDLFLLIAEQADLPTIGRLALVCKLWNEFVNSSQLWKQLSEKEGIPLVECRKGQERNLKSDFRILRSITISGKIISEFFGKMVAAVPPIQEAILTDWLKRIPSKRENASKKITYLS